MTLMQHNKCMRHILKGVFLSTFEHNFSYSLGKSSSNSNPRWVNPCIQVPFLMSQMLVQKGPWECLKSRVYFSFKWEAAYPADKCEEKKKNFSVANCFTIPFPCFPFCHFSIILGISVRQALFLKLPLFHRFLYFMISTSSSLAERTEVETWGNQAATVTC